MFSNTGRRKDLRLRKEIAENLDSRLDKFASKYGDPENVFDDFGFDKEDYLTDILSGRLSFEEIEEVEDRLKRHLERANTFPGSILYDIPKNNDFEGFDEGYEEKFLDNCLSLLKDEPRIEVNRDDKGQINIREADESKELLSQNQGLKKGLSKVAGIVGVGLSLGGLAAGFMSDQGGSGPGPDTAEKLPGDPGEYKIDSDGDGFSNGFEKYIADTDPKSPNERYALLYNSFGDGSLKPIRDELLEDGVPKDHIYWRKSENATKTNFASDVNRLIKKTDSNDIIYVGEYGTGNEDGFWFKTSAENILSSISNRKMDQILDYFNSEVVMGLDYSNSGDSLDKISEGNRTVMTSTKEGQDMYPSAPVNPFKERRLRGINRYFGEALNEKSADLDGNGFVSVPEACRYSKDQVKAERWSPDFWFPSKNPLTWFPEQDPQISKPDSQDNLYLVENRVDNQSDLSLLEDREFRNKLYATTYAGIVGIGGVGLIYNAEKFKEENPDGIILPLI